jgi:AcrR family transcriptional regulator
VTDAPESTRSPKGVARRRQIIDMAIRRFAERGVESASMRDIAAAIGVSHTALRHYFASRDELLVEVYRAHEAGVLDDPPVTGDDPLGLLIDAAERNRAIPGLVELYASLTTDAVQAGHPAAREFVTGRFAALRDAVAVAVRAAQRAGRLPADADADDLAALVVAASDGLQLQWMLAPDTVDVARSLRLFERLLGVVPSQKFPLAGFTEEDR